MLEMHSQTTYVLRKAKTDKGAVSLENRTSNTKQLQLKHISHCF